MSEQSTFKDLLSRVSSCIRQNCRVQAGDKIVVAVSGGSDSLALLYLLYLVEIVLDLTAVYIDHGLRPEETPLEKSNILKHCKKLGIPLITQRVDVPLHARQHRNSPEESARILRYHALEKIRGEQGAQAVAVGHTADDQVEEFFIRLIRGSGVKGLSGMRWRRGTIVRPLLLESKKRLQEFLLARNVDWSFDSSNDNRTFLRNRIRLDLLPLLEADFNRSIRKTVLQTMDILRTEDDCLSQQTSEPFLRCVDRQDSHPQAGRQDSITIDVRQFSALHPALARRVVEKCLWQMETRPSFEQIRAVMQLVEEGANGSEIHLAGGLRAVKLAGDVAFLRPFGHISSRMSLPTLEPVNMNIDNPGSYPLAVINRELILSVQSIADSGLLSRGTLVVDMDKISFPLRLRSFVPGDRFFPCSGPGRKKVARFLSDRKIPARQRPAWPVLLSGEKIVALPGLEVDHDYRVSAATKRILRIVWRELN
ncbi:MAG: tRNA lysidine(34) synthetase TilS [Desulforhopalus sp.]